MENRGGGQIMRRGPMGSGYGYNNDNYRDGVNNMYGNDDDGNMPQGNTLGGAPGEGGEANAVNHQRGNNANDEMRTDKLDDLSLGDDEQTLEYYAARAHAAQMLAREEAKRLEDNLKRVERKRKMQIMTNNGSSKNATDSKTTAKSNTNHGSASEAGFYNGGNNTMKKPRVGYENTMQGSGLLSQFNVLQGNRGTNQQSMQQQGIQQQLNVPQQEGPAAAQDYYKQGNMNTNNRNHILTISNDTPNTDNFNYANLPSKDEVLLEQSRMNYYHMNMRNVNNHTTAQGRYDNMNGMSYNNFIPYQNRYTMLPMNTMMPNTMMQLNIDMVEKKRDQPPTISDPSKLPVIQPTPEEETKIVQPRRPLSAYNIFFSEMRNIIVEEHTKDDVEKKNDTPILADEDFTQALMKKRFSSESKKRVHRKTHGKVAFTTLAQTVGKRWKELSEESKKRYKELAELDRERYKKEKMAVQTARREEAKRARKHNTSVATADNNVVRDSMGEFAVV